MPEAAILHAHMARTNLGLSQYSPVDIWRVLMDEKISVLMRPATGKFSGAFITTGETKVILINSSFSLGHQRYTAAHEYYHLKYHPHLLGRTCSNEETAISKEEHEANLFAANFLAPNTAINYYLEKRCGYTSGMQLHMGDIISLEIALGLSHQAMLKRLISMGLLTDTDAATMAKGVRARARELGYSTELYDATNKLSTISDYAEKARLAFEKGHISRGKYEELLLEASLSDILYPDEEDSDDVESSSSI